MKKKLSEILSLILCVALVFTSVDLPVLASDSRYEETDFEEFVECEESDYEDESLVEETSVEESIEETIEETEDIQEDVEDDSLSDNQDILQDDVLADGQDANEIEEANYQFDELEITQLGLDGAAKIDDIVVSSVDELQSSHNYEDNIDCTWIYSDPNAAELKITFSSDTAVEIGADYIYIYDENDNQIGTDYTGSQLANKTITVPYGTVKIRLVSDDSTSKYGFRVDNIVALNSISVNALPTISVNRVGQDPDYTGINIIGNYDDGNVVDLTSECTFGSIDKTTAGAKTVTVTYRNLTTTFDTEYSNVEIASISVSTNMTKTSYYLGEDLDPAGLVLAAEDGFGNDYYVTEGYTITGFNNLAVGTQTLTVEYEGKTTTTSVVVKYGFTYTTSSGKVTVSGLASTDVKTLIIPGTVNGNPVTTIAGSAFKDKTSLETVELPASITSMGTDAFSGCTNLKNINLPSGITTISNYTFQNCKALTKIIIPANVTSIGNSAFSGCENLGNVVIPSKVTSIGTYAFSGCKKITEVSFPDGLLTISDYAYSGAGLTNLEIPDSVTTIGKGSFKNNPLVSIKVPFVGGVRRTSTSSSGIGCLGYIFDSASNNTTVTVSQYDFYYYIPSTLRSVEVTNAAVISNYAFQNCSMLTEIKLNEGITSIGDYVFQNCNGITEMELPSTVETIGNSVFYGNTKLESVYFPDSITSIGTGNTSLKNCVIYTTNPYVKEYAASNNCNAVSYFASLSSNSISMGRGEQIELEFTVTNLDGTPATDYEAVWSSSDENVVTVSNNTITAVGMGTAIVSVAIDTIELKCTVFVDVPAQSISANNILDTYCLGESIDYEVVFDPDDSTDTYTWSSDNTEVIKVNVDGTLNCVGVGIANITVTSSSGASSTYFVEVVNDISYAEITLKETSYMFTGAEISAEFDSRIYQLLFGNSGNVQITYSNNVNVGTASVTIKGIGQYQGEVTLNFDIVERNISSCDIKLDLSDETYSENAIEKEISISNNGILLVEDTDYTVTYSENTLPGEATVSINGIGNYNGNATYHFTINKIPQNVNTSIGKTNLIIGETTIVSIRDAIGTVTYHTSNENVATVSSAGLITAVSDGTAVITVRAAGDEYHAPIEKTFTLTITSKYGTKYTSGTTGSLTWTIYNSSSGTRDVLVISGTGSMPNYSMSSYRTTAPWESYLYKIKYIYIEDGVTSIGKYAFLSTASGCYLNELVIGDTVTNIGIEAFLGVNIVKMTMPLTLSVGTDAFSMDSTLKEVHLTKGNGTSFSHENDWAELPWYINSTKNLGMNIYVEEGVTTISPYTFYLMQGYVFIKLPSTLKVIGESAFSGCMAIKNITIPDGVTKIEQEAFAGCCYLETIAVPGSVESIGKNAFTIINPLNSSEKVYLKSIYIYNPDCDINYTVTTIHPESVVIYGYAGSTAERYAERYNRQFVQLDCSIVGHIWNDYYTIDWNPSTVMEGQKSIHCSVCGGIKPSSEVSIPKIILTCEAPRASIESGEIEFGKSISLSTETEEADIYYTTDGSVPSATNGTLYSGPITITEDITIKAIAIKDTYVDSEVAEYIYTIEIKLLDESGWGDIVPADRLEIASKYNVAIKDVQEYMIPSGFWITGVKDHIYTGSAITYPDMHIYWNTKMLLINRDYTVKYSNNTKAGTAKITITGKGNYTGSIIKEFQILPVSISPEDGNILAPDITLVFNNRVQKGVTTVTCLVNGRTVTLKSGTDFTYVYPGIDSKISGYDPNAFKAVSSEPYVVSIVGKGNYTGTATFNQTIIAADSGINLISKVSVAKIPDQEYEGKGIEPEVVINNGALKEGTDYELTYLSNVNVGTAYIIIKGINGYSGTKVVTFKIIGVALSKATISGFIDSYVYTGDEIEQNVVFTYNNNGVVETLYKDQDYTVTYTNNVKAGTATVIFTGIGGFTGIVKKTYKIVAYSIDPTKELNNRVRVDEIGEVAYQKGGVKPLVNVYDKDVLLIEGVDYTLKYTNNTTVTTDGVTKYPTVTITGKGNYTGSRNVYFTITKSSLNETSVIVTDIVYQNKPNICKPVITITDVNGNKLVAGVDYNKEIIYSYVSETNIIQYQSGVRTAVTVAANTQIHDVDIIPAGTLICAKIQGINNYYGSEKEVTFRYVTASIASAKVTIPTQIYTGREITLQKADFNIKVGKVTLTADDFEIVSYKNNINKGTASVTIRGIGEYGGIKTVTFKIVANSIDKYTIIFSSNYATSGAVKDLVLKTTETKPLPANAFARAGYTFTGWNTKPDGTGISYSDKEYISGVGNGGKTTYLYAQWALDTYSITYVLDGGTNSSYNPSSYTVISDSTVLSNPSRVHYTFAGWYLDSSYKTKVTSIEKGRTGNITLYAKWVGDTYYIIFDGNGSTGGRTSTMTCTYGKTYNLTANGYTRTDFKFAGWNTRADGTGKSYNNKESISNLVSTSNGTITLYAQWKYNGYGIGETWTVPGNWEFTIDSIETHYRCNSYNTNPGEQVVIISYHYKNLGYTNSLNNGLFISSPYFTVYDQYKNVGTIYPCTHITSPKRISTGATCYASIAYIVPKTSDNIYLEFDAYMSYDSENRFDKAHAKFLLPLK